MTRRSRRLALIAVALAVIGVRGGNRALCDCATTIVFFYSPSEIAEKAVQPGARLRIGGLVKADTLVKSSGQNVAFVVTDGAHELRVAYQGLLPDLFREGQGVVAEGVLGGARRASRRNHSRQTRRALYAARSRGRAEEAGPLAGRGGERQVIFRRPK